MPLPIDFVAALTTEPSTDFVSALSAEQGCDVCHELHASVYELRCSLCEAAICPDCARLRADTAMACLICHARRPGQAIVARGGRPSMIARIREESATLRLALVQLANRVRAGEGLLANLRLWVAAWRRGGRERIAYTRVMTTGLPVRDAITRSARELSVRARGYSARARELSARAGTVLQERSAMVLARSRGNAASASRRATALAIAASQRSLVGARASREFLGRNGRRFVVEARRATTAFRAVARRGWARSTELGMHTRRAAAHGWVTLRSLPVRHHTSALLLTTLLLYAVARADHRD